MVAMGFAFRLALPILLALGAGCTREGPASELSDEEVVERFTDLFGRKSEETVFANRFLGIVTMQNPNDVWVTQEIIAQTRPDFIVEAGTYRGGSAALWALILTQVNLQGRVITIDIVDRVREKAKRLPIMKSVDFLVGSSTDPAIVEEVKHRTAGGRVMVILDSLHTKEHVLAELRAYSDLVPVGGYLIVQDTGGVMMQREDPGPAQALEAFLAENDRFEPDRTRERLLLTLHPKGYLKRVR
jgi:cephalosporin hydroxylase